MCLARKDRNDPESIKLLPYLLLMMLLLLLGLLPPVAAAVSRLFPGDVWHDSNCR